MPAQGFSEPTYSVAQLAGEIRELLSEALARVWVVGELQRARASQNGHLYFELIEKGRGDTILGKLDAVIWRGELLRVRRILERSGAELVEGRQIRCYGQLDFYAPTGKLQLVVREVDPLFTLGELERRRRTTLAELQRLDLLERNRRLELSPVPLRLGLITSKESAAYHDFLTGLAESGYGFQIVLVHAAVQGATAEAEVVSALRLLEQTRPGGDPLDAVVLIRGGGARSDLAIFDSRAVTLAVAQASLPILCGLGHETDSTLTDLVCHSSLKTPTKVAEALVARVAASENSIVLLRQRLGLGSARLLAQAERDLRRLDRLPLVARHGLASLGQNLDDRQRALVLLAGRRLREAERQVEEKRRRLSMAGPRTLARRLPSADALARRLVARATAILKERRTWLEGATRLCHEVAPERLLERGFSITRTETGQLVRSPDQVRSGAILWTRLAAFAVKSRVEES